MKYTREDYMNNRVTHKEYYGQFVTEGLKNVVARRMGVDAIHASKDEHMNDIALFRWDNMDRLIPQDVIREIQRASGTKAYSLSDIVCVAKEAARQMKHKKPNPSPCPVGIPLPAGRPNGGKI